MVQDQATEKKPGFTINTEAFDMARAAGTALMLKLSKSDKPTESTSSNANSLTAMVISLDSLMPPPPPPSSVVAAPKELTLPKQEWFAYALRQHTDLVELRERTRCFIKEIDQWYEKDGTGRTEVKESLSRSFVLQSVMQYLEYAGCGRTRRVIEEEAHEKFQSQSIPDRSLQSLLRLGIHDPKTIFVIEEKNTQSETQADTEVEVIDHRSSRSWQEAKAEKSDFGNIKIWDETEMSQNLTLSKTGEVLAGTINKLIEHMTSENCHDPNFLNTFLVTYQSFITPDQLLSTLLDRYNVPREKFARLKADEFRRSIEFPIQQRVFTVLRAWVTDHFSDFNDKLLEQLNHFVSTVLMSKGQRHWARQLRNIISQNQTTLELPRPNLDNAPDPKVPRNVFSPSVDLFDVDEEEIARQMTILEWNFYMQIQSVEFLNKAWLKPRNPKNQNILNMIKRTEDVSQWVAFTIVSQEKLKSRSKLLQKFIGMAHHLRQLNNLNTCMAVLDGLRKPAVKKLRWSREELPKKTAELWIELEKTFPSKMDYRAIKEYLKKLNPPVLPPIEPYVRELTTVEDTHSDMVNNRLINFRMLKSVLQVIQDYRFYRGPGYSLLPVFQIQYFIASLDENALKATDDELVKLATSREG